LPRPGSNSGGQPGAAPTREIIRDLAEGRIAKNASEAERGRPYPSATSICSTPAYSRWNTFYIVSRTLVDLKKAAQHQHHSWILGYPAGSSRSFMISDLEKWNSPHSRPYRKLPGDSPWSCGPENVDRSRVQAYLKRGDIPDSVWQKLKKWSVFMEKRYPPQQEGHRGGTDGGKILQQLAIGLFNQCHPGENREVRVLMASVFKDLLEVNRKKSKKGGPRKDDLLKLLRGIMEEVFEIRKRPKGLNQIMNMGARKMTKELLINGDRSFERIIERIGHEEYHLYADVHLAGRPPRERYGPRMLNAADRGVKIRSLRISRRDL
jgi:hypothetical protein